MRNGGSDPKASYEVVYLDDEIIVVNKGSGLLTVPGKGPEKQDSLLLRLRNDLGNHALHAAHRLDRDTSGLLVFGLTKAAHRALSISFQERRVHKKYIGRVLGAPPKSNGSIDAPIGRSSIDSRRYAVVDDGRPSLSQYTTLARDKHTTLLSLIPITGRTQQLRIHLAFLGIPLLGDTIHGSGTSDTAATRLCLHAARLEFDDPRTCTEHPPRLAFVSNPTFDDTDVHFF